MIEPRDELSGYPDHVLEQIRKKEELTPRPIKSDFLIASEELHRAKNELSNLLYHLYFKPCLDFIGKLFNK